MDQIKDRAVVLLQLLQEESDADHKIPMADLINALQRRGIRAARKSVYESIAFLKKCGYPVHFSRAGDHQGYWIDHILSPAEAFVISDAVASSPAISRNDTDRLLGKIQSALSVHERKLLPSLSSEAKEASNNTLSSVSLLLDAIHRHHTVEFRYYDLTLDGEKAYRRNGAFYSQIPYAIASFQGRYYCIFYSPVYKGFANYRIDKMDHMRVLDDQNETVPFDLSDWMKQSFYMYRGEPVTVVIEAQRSMASIVMDQFQQNLIIMNVTDKTFTAGIRTSLSPTLTAWLLEFYDRIIVRKPEALVNELVHIADAVQKTYNTDTKEDR